MISGDPEAADHLVALASASEVVVDLCDGAAAVAARWTRAPAVVVGIDSLRALRDANLPRRQHVVVFGHATADAWRCALELGAHAVIEPPGPQGWLAELVERAGGTATSGVVVGVTGCRGGAGASVFASAFAVAAARRRLSPYLLDLDPWGCGLAVVLGADRLDALTWDQVRAGAGRIPSRSLQDTIGSVDGIRLLGWAEDASDGLPPGVSGSVVDAARLSATLTVVDLGRSGADFQREAMGRCDRVLMIVPADVRAVQAARRMVRRQDMSMCEVVVRGPNPGGLTTQDIAEAVGLPVIAAMAADRWLDERLERGEPPGYRTRTPLARAGAGILQEVLA